MVVRRPLVLVSGLLSELPSGDYALAGTSSLEVLAGSGLSGGGFLSSAPTYDIALAPQASGLILVSDALALDGVALRTSSTALASGSDAAFNASAALSSGNAALRNSVAALASGNQAIQVVAPLAGGGSKVNLVAATTIPAGTPVGFNNAGQIEPIRQSPFVLPVATGVIGSGGSWIQPTGVLTPYYSVKACRNTTISNKFKYSDKYQDFVFVSQPVSYGHYGTFDAGPNGYLQVKNNVVSAYGFALTTSLSNPSKINYIKELDTYVFIAGDSTAYPSMFTFNRDDQYVYREAHTVFESIAADNFASIALPSGVLLAAYYQSSRGKCRACTVSRYSNLGTQQNFSYGTATYVTLSPNKNPTRGLVFFRNNANYLAATIIDTDINTLEVSVGEEQILLPANAYPLDSIYLDYEDSYLVPTYAGSSVQLNKIKETSPNVFTIIGSGIFNSTNTQFDLAYSPTNRLIGFVGASGSRPVGGYIQSSGDSFTPAAFTTFLADISATYTSCDFHKATGQLYMGYVQNGQYQINVMPSFNSDFNALPTCNKYSNFIGISNNTVTSGQSCTVSLPGDTYIYSSGSFTPGLPLYLDPVTSGFRTDSDFAVSWSGQVPWAPVAQATSTSGLILLNQL